MVCLNLDDVLNSGCQSQSTGLCPACQPVFEYITRGDADKCPDCQPLPDPHLHTQNQYHASIPTCPGCRLINSFFRLPKQNTSNTPAKTLLIRPRRFDLFDEPDSDRHRRFNGGLIVLVDDQQQMAPIGRILASENPEEGSSNESHHLEYPQGRIVPPTINTDLVRAWMQSCNLNHQQCMSTHEKAPVPLRLIDVEQFKVIEATTCYRYVALSYVWGENTEPLLTRERLPKFSLQGGIQQVDFPRTIINAIHFSREIGHRYIWVDSMCIVQDDANDKKMQLPNMGQIYRDADLVMVAAAGDSVQAGIPGTGDNERERWQQVESIGHWDFITTDPKVSWVVNGTHWNTRGWTFQEAYLARRILLFTKTQVFWICQEMTWREDTKLEPYPRSPESHGLESLWGSADEYDGNLSRRRCRTREYCRNVEIFSERNFKDKSDSMWAYTGILEAQLASFPQGYIWGVPFEIIDVALLWRYSCGGTTYRDEIPRRLKIGLTHGALPYPAPSWAWLSSAHSVAFHSLCGNLVSEVSWLSPVELKSRRDISIWSLVSNRAFDIMRPKSTPEPRLDWTSDGMQYKYLHFAANTAALVVMFDGNAQCNDSGSPEKDDNTYLGAWRKRLFNIDSHRRAISALWPFWKPQDDSPPKTIMRQASILWAGESIGRMSIPEDYIRHGSERLGQLVLLSSNTEDKEDGRCITSSVAQDCGNIIHVRNCDHIVSHNVMLMEWEGGIAYRRALGVVNKDDWAKVKVQKRNIILG